METRGEDPSVLAVSDRPEKAEAQLLAGYFGCPSCAAGALGPWGYAREREIRFAETRRRLRFRRSRCQACMATHVLVPISTLVRRLDAVEVIGAALQAKLAGLGHRRIAYQLGRPAATVRGWLRRFSQRALAVWALAAGLAHRFDSDLGPFPVRGSPTGDAVEALGAAVAAFVRRHGPVPSPWHLVAGMTGTLMLSTASLPSQ